MSNKKEAAEILLKRRKARSNLLDFTTYTKADYKVNWHHRLICEKLDEFIEGKNKRLIIACPPRHGKTELVSRRFPAYLLGRNPDARIIACSYGSDLASLINRDVQRIIDSPEYIELFPDTRLNSSNVRATSQENYLRNSDIFEIVGHKGVYRSAGVGGSITGMGGDCLLIDDPFRSRADAESPTIRNKVWEWYSSTLRTRRQKGASILLTATRWHENDLTGKLLELAENDPSSDQWEVINLPALSEDEIEPYDIRTEPNQALWVEEFPIDDLLRTKASLTVYEWLSLYQQRPSAAKGNIFESEYFQYFTETALTYDLQKHDGTIEQIPKSMCTTFQTCDPAGTAKTKSDFFVLSTWALTPKKDILLLDIFRSKIEGPDHVDFIKQQRLKWNPSVLGFESAAIGKTTYQNLERERFPLVDLNPKGDKFSRALSAAITLKSRKTYFRFGAHWLTEWEEELLHFPNGAHDDQVDTYSYAEFMVSNGLVRMLGAAAKSPFVEKPRNMGRWETSSVPQW